MTKFLSEFPGNYNLLITRCLKTPFLLQKKYARLTLLSGSDRKFVQLLGHHDLQAVLLVELIRASCPGSTLDCLVSMSVEHHRPNQNSRHSQDGRSKRCVLSPQAFFWHWLHFTCFTKCTPACMSLADYAQVVTYRGRPLKANYWIHRSLQTISYTSTLRVIIL